MYASRSAQQLRKQAQEQQPYLHSYKADVKRDSTIACDELLKMAEEQAQSFKVWATTPPQERKELAR
jgi:hypothetical protein